MERPTCWQMLRALVAQAVEKLRRGPTSTTGAALAWVKKGADERPSGSNVSRRSHWSVSASLGVRGEESSML